MIEIKPALSLSAAETEWVKKNAMVKISTAADGRILETMCDLHSSY